VLLVIKSTRDGFFTSIAASAWCSIHASWRDHSGFPFKYRARAFKMPFVLFVGLGRERRVLAHLADGEDLGGLGGRGVVDVRQLERRLELAIALQHLRVNVHQDHVGPIRVDDVANARERVAVGGEVLVADRRDDQSGRLRLGRAELFLELLVGGVLRVGVAHVLRATQGEERPEENRG